MGQEWGAWGQVVMSAFGSSGNCSPRLSSPTVRLSSKVFASRATNVCSSLYILDLVPGFESKLWLHLACVYFHWHHLAHAGQVIWGGGHEPFAE